MTVQFLDSRRLTGSNLLWSRPGAVLDIGIEEQDPDAVIDVWRGQIRRVLDAVGWNAQETCVRRFNGGVSVAISAPVDALYAATDINEWAFDAVLDVLAGRPEPPLGEDIEQLRRLIHDESNPALIKLRDAAHQRDLPILSDTEELSIGLGRHSGRWPLDALPTIDNVDWTTYSRIPVALITGTNGKTTSVRLTAAIARAAGHIVGTTSTDGISVDSNTVDSGDFSGPEGARTVLRDPRVEFAVLETARGGLLRRGLALSRVDSALITNVAADHLGEFGVHDLNELADVKWVVTRALDRRSSLVLNADDPLLVERAASCDCKLVWYSPNPDNYILRTHIDGGGDACTVIDEKLALIWNHTTHLLTPIADIPITLEGNAAHNICNALGAAALTASMGLPPQTIATGLKNMTPADNPGRGNIYRIAGATVIVDFAHNPHGVSAFLNTAQRLDARRRTLLIGQAGDRGDADIRELAASACAMSWDKIVIKEMPAYARGRDAGEVVALLRDEFERRGIPPERLDCDQHELEAVKQIVSELAPGDLAVLLVHERRDDVLAYLEASSAARGRVPA